MRRKDREITKLAEIAEIMEKCDACTLALQDGAYPYGVVMSFGISTDNGKVRLYFHCAEEGKKLELIRDNPKAAFTMYCRNEFRAGDKACSCTTSFESVSGRGVIRLTEEAEKKKALDAILSHYIKEKQFEYDEKYMAVTAVLCMDVDTITGKRHL